MFPNNTPNPAVAALGSASARGVTGVNAGYFSSKGEVKENGTTHTNSTVSSNKIIGKEISALVNQCMFFGNELNLEKWSIFSII